MKLNSKMRYLSLFGAWAFAFGCAVGSDAFVLPWTTFLPGGGPLGTVLGLVVGGLVMSAIAWNYHYMMNRHPGSGGVYTYASEVFGRDHGFLCGYFLGFAYVAIVWLDMTALVTLGHYTMGDLLNFGFKYTVEGRTVWLGDILFAIVASVAVAAICCRRKISAIVQTVMAVIFAAGIIVCFVAALFHWANNPTALGPMFAPSDSCCISQALGILVIAPWLFVGIETISNLSGEFRFSLRNSFMVMLAAILATVVSYVMLTAIPIFVCGDKGWPAAVSSIANAFNSDFYAFDMVRTLFGRAGFAMMGIVLMGGIFTNLVGNTIAASRIATAMANDDALPSIFSEENSDGSPYKAVLLIAASIIVIAPFGRAVIGVVVDIAIIGAAIAYGYTSAAAFRTARQAGDKRTQRLGVAGTVISSAVVIFVLKPILSLEASSISTMSYLILVAWGISGLALFLAIFRRDHLRRYGRSPIVWMSMFMMILILSFIWVSQSTHDATEAAYDSIVSYHERHCKHNESKDNDRHEENVHLSAALRANLSVVNSSIIRNNLLQGGLSLLALALMLCLYNALRRREREIMQEKVNAKSYFFSTVSHDIRTPLNAIIGFSEMLKVGFKTDAERNQATDAIITSGKTLLGLINDVLDLSKLESGKMEISLEPTDCVRLMRDLTESFRVANNKPNVDIRCSIGKMPMLMIDPQRLRQIVFNLFGNAVKFTKRGHVTLRVSFERHGNADTGVFRLEVEDTGCGISEEDLKRIGSAYVQVGSKVGRNGGTGLGLAICKQLSAAMGGRLEVESEFGKGSKFSIVVPDVKIAPDDVVLSKNDEAVEKQEEASQCSVHRILLADDSKMNIMVLKALLKHFGEFEIETAADGEEALKILETPDKEPFDLVLTDMWMPNLDGEGLVKAIRSKTALASLRVIVVTADVEFQAKFDEMGFDGILLKPITSERLRTVLTTPTGGG